MLNINGCIFARYYKHIRLISSDAKGEHCVLRAVCSVQTGTLYYHFKYHAFGDFPQTYLIHATNSNGEMKTERFL